jgi:hypothetical protein
MSPLTPDLTSERGPQLVFRDREPLRVRILGPASRLERFLGVFCINACFCPLLKSHFRSLIGPYTLMNWALVGRPARAKRRVPSAMFARAAFNAAWCPVSAKTPRPGTGPPTRLSSTLERSQEQFVSGQRRVPHRCVGSGDVLRSCHQSRFDAVGFGTICHLLAAFG